VTILEHLCPCGSAHRLTTDVEARLDDDFRYPGGVVVHPHVFRSVLAREPWIVEYQVRRTPTGAEALVIGAVGDPGAVGRALEKELAQVGVAGPCVEVRVVDRLERQAVGKVRRFQPIPG
jgi:phenylacetate-CoA ligase